MTDIIKIRFAIAIYAKLPDFCSINADERQKAMGLSYAEGEPAGVAAGAVAFAVEFGRLYAGRTRFDTEGFAERAVKPCERYLERKYVTRRVGDRRIMEAGRDDLAAELSMFLFDSHWGMAN